MWRVSLYDGKLSNEKPKLIELLFFFSFEWNGPETVYHLMLSVCLIQIHKYL